MTEEKASKKVKSAVSSAKAKVNRLTREYKAAQAELDEFFEEYSDIMKEYERLAKERNVALDKLKRGCKAANLSAGPFKVTIQNTRTFDGQYLYSTLDDTIRDEVVELQYKVQTKVFDQYVQAGDIDLATAKRAVTGITPTSKAFGGPKEIVVS